MRSLFHFSVSKAAFLAVFGIFSTQNSFGQLPSTYDTGLRFELKKGGKFPAISQIWPNSPAAAAGAKVGETLWSLDGASVEGLSVAEIHARLAGGDSKHDLQIGTEKREIKLKSAKIKGKCLSGNCESGRGAWLDPDGSKYEGDFAAGRYHGKGSMVYASGNRHEGQYLDGKRSGAGKFSFANGTVYEGNFENNDFEGTGKIRHKSGETYEGEFHADLRQGKGKAVYPSGDAYDGDWADDQKHGQGKFVAADGSVYEGAWSQGQQSGFGKKISYEGWAYEGNWKNDQRSGFGKLTTATGDRVEGTFAADELPSSGRVFFADGKKYEGQLAGGKPHGYGRCELVGGHLFDGNFADGQPRSGVLALSNGQKKQIECETWAELFSKIQSNPAGQQPPSAYQDSPARREPPTVGRPDQAPIARASKPSAELSTDEVANAKAILEGGETDIYERSENKFSKGSKTAKRPPEQTPMQQQERFSKNYAASEADEFDREVQPQPDAKRRNAAPRTVSDDGLSPEAREALAILEGEERAAEMAKYQPKKSDSERKSAEKRPLPTGTDKTSLQKKRLLEKIDGFYDHVRTSENWLADNAQMIGKARRENLTGLSEMSAAWAASTANFRESFPTNLSIPNRIAAIDATERFLDANRKLAQNFQRLAFLSAEWLGSKSPEKEAELAEIRLSIDTLLPMHEARFEAARKAIF